MLTLKGKNKLTAITKTVKIKVSAVNNFDYSIISRFVNRENNKTVTKNAKLKLIYDKTAV